MAKVILQEINPDNYFKDSLKVVKKFAAGKNAIFVSLTRGIDTLLNNFSEEKMDPKDFFFIDVTTKKSVANNPDKENVLFLESPQDLTVLSLSLSEIAKKIKGKKILFIGAINIFFVYNNASTVNKFLSFVINKMRALDIDVVLFYTTTKEHQDDILEVSSTVDEVRHTIAK